jgi:cysteine dioxygenase
MIKTIEDLIDTLETASSDRFAQIIQQISITEDSLKHFATWLDEGYTRNCLMRNNDYEIILLCWDKGAKTAIHGHGGENCWVYQVSGTVEEIRYTNINDSINESERLALNPGRISFMHDRMGFHAIQNISNDKAMTLHIYASPIDRCKVYNDEKDCFEMKTMSYDTERLVS